MLYAHQYAFIHINMLLCTSICFYAHQYAVMHINMRLPSAQRLPSAHQQHQLEYPIHLRNRKQQDDPLFRCLNCPIRKWPFELLSLQETTSTDRYLDFTSNNPISHKANTVKTLLKRAVTICSTE